MTKGIRLSLLALLVLVAGCGASDDAADVPTTVPTATPRVRSDWSGCWAAYAGTPVTQGEGAGTMGERRYPAPPAIAIDPTHRYTATMETNKGTFEVEFYPDDAPQTVNNFVCLARDGYYDGTPFHRIVQGFVIQGGDPTGTGAGGPGYRFADEPVRREYERGILAMANAGPNTNGSQFFVVLQDLRGQLPKNYTIFGRVIAGQEVVDAIAQTPTRTPPGGREQSQPTEPITLERVTIHEAEGAATPAASPAATP